MRGPREVSRCGVRSFALVVQGFPSYGVAFAHSVKGPFQVEPRSIQMAGCAAFVLDQETPRVFSLPPDVRDVKGIEGTSFGPLMAARKGLDKT
jgi:hypothetical protein